MPDTKPNMEYVSESMENDGQPVCKFDKKHGMYGGNMVGKGFQAVTPKAAKDSHKPF